jgi:hypothetical protein
MMPNHGRRTLTVIMGIMVINDAESWEEDTYRYHGYYIHNMMPNHGSRTLTGIMGIMVIISP